MSTEPTPMGTLTEEEMGSIAQLRQNASQLLNSLGQLELRRSRLVQQLEQNELQAQQVLLSARDRLEIPEGTPWQVQDDGQIFVVSPASEG
jgi:hypothetical protein